MEYENFHAKIWKQNESLIITIPTNTAKYAGYKEGDILKIQTRKQPDFKTADQIQKWLVANAANTHQKKAKFNYITKYQNV